MRDKTKKLLAVASATLLGASLFLTGCGSTTDYKGDKINDYVSNAAVSSNGGFAVQKGDFVYFINGVEGYTADNVYGEVLKGSLQRIKAADLQSGNYDEVKTIVPSLFVAQDYTSGIYIYGDYVYYATPTTNKNMVSGETDYTSIDFKRAKLDGKQGPMEDYYFRLKKNSSRYRFVEEGNVVYCLYEEDGALKSYNTSTRKTTVLVKDAVNYYYDKTDLTNPYVYYTMSVQEVDTENKNKESYTQLYCVNAATTATAKSSTAKVEISNGISYDFDEKYLQAENKKAKDDGDDEPYVLSDYSTYPYVNLGNLVLDGVGSCNEETMFNTDGIDGALSSNGYTYTIAGVENGGVYFMRDSLTQNGSVGVSNQLYYLQTSDVFEDGYNAVKANGEKAANGNVEIVANSTASIIDSTTKLLKAIPYKENGKHAYLYTATEGSDTVLKRYAYNEETESFEDVKMLGGMADSTLWKVDTQKKILYFYNTKTSYEEGATGSTNGKNLCLIDYSGSANDYNVEENFGGDENSSKYAPVVVPLMDWVADWYKPEIFGDTVLYANARTYNTNAYKYVFATKIDKESIKANTQAVKTVEDEISKRDKASTKAVLTYYYRTGLTTAYDDVKDLYSQSQQTSISEFIAKFTAEEMKLEKDIIALVGKMTEEDIEFIEKEWTASLKLRPKTPEEKGLEWWAILLIVVGGVIVVGAAVCIPLFIVANNKKKAKKAEEEATINAYKRKRIDTTDDKTIDVYTDEETAAESEVKTEEQKDE